MEQLTPEQRQTEREDERLYSLVHFQLYLRTILAGGFVFAILALNSQPTSIWLVALFFSISILGTYMANMAYIIQGRVRKYAPEQYKKIRGIMKKIAPVCGVPVNSNKEAGEVFDHTMTAAGKFWTGVSHAGFMIGVTAFIIDLGRTLFNYFF